MYVVNIISIFLHWFYKHLKYGYERGYKKLQGRHNEDWGSSSENKREEENWLRRLCLSVAVLEEIAKEEKGRRRR